MYIYILLCGCWILAAKFKPKCCLSVLALAPPSAAGVAIAVNPLAAATEAADLATTFAGTAGITEALGSAEATAAGRQGQRLIYAEFFFDEIRGMRANQEGRLGLSLTFQSIIQAEA